MVVVGGKGRKYGNIGLNTEIHSLVIRSQGNGLGLKASYILEFFSSKSFFSGFILQEEIKNRKKGIITHKFYINI